MQTSRTPGLGEGGDRDKCIPWACWPACLTGRETPSLVRDSLKKGRWGVIEKDAQSWALVTCTHIHSLYVTWEAHNTGSSMTVYSYQQYPQEEELKKFSKHSNTIWTRTIDASVLTGGGGTVSVIGGLWVQDPLGYIVRLCLKIQAKPSLGREAAANLETPRKLFSNHQC